MFQQICIHSSYQFRTTLLATTAYENTQNHKLHYYFAITYYGRKLYNNNSKYWNYDFDYFVIIFMSHLT